MAIDQTYSEVRSREGDPNPGDLTPKQPASETKQVRSPLLDVIKASHKASSKQILEIDLTRPFLVPPKSIKSVPAVPNLKKISQLESLLSVYDRAFVAGQIEYAEELAKKGKYTDKLAAEHFNRQIVFAYCFPKEKHLNRTAKKFAHQAVKRSMDKLAKDHKDKTGDNGSEAVAEHHRLEMKEMIEYSLECSYLSLFSKSIEHLPEIRQRLLVNLLFHPEMKSYLKSEIKEIFYRYETKAAKEARKNYGAPEDFEIRLKKVKAPQGLSEWLFSDDLYWKELIQDSLYFYKVYEMQVDKEYPPLLPEEKRQLLQALRQGEESLPEHLRKTAENCYRESRALTMAKFNDLHSSWNCNPATIGFAFQFMIAFETAADNAKSLSKEDAVLIVNSLRDRSLTEKLQEKSLDRQFEELLWITKVSMPHANDVASRVSDNAHFIWELEGELGAMDSQTLQQLISSTAAPNDRAAEEKSEIISRCINRTRVARNLSEDWKPSISTIKTIVKIESPLVAYQKKNIRYLQRLIHSCTNITNLLEADNSGLSKSMETLMQIAGDAANEALMGLCLNIATHPEIYPSNSELFRTEALRKNITVLDKIRESMEKWHEEPANKKLIPLALNLMNLIESSITPSYSQVLSTQLDDMKNRYKNLSNSTIKQLDTIYIDALSDNTKKQLSSALVFANATFYSYCSGHIPNPEIISHFADWIEKIILETSGNRSEAKVAKYAAIQPLEISMLITSVLLLLLRSGVTPVNNVSSFDEGPISRGVPSTVGENIMAKVRQHWVNSGHTTNAPIIDTLKGVISEQTTALAAALARVYALPTDYESALSNRIIESLEKLDELLTSKTSEKTLDQELKILVQNLVVNFQDDINAVVHSAQCKAFSQYFLENQSEKPKIPLSDVNVSYWISAGPLTAFLTDLAAELELLAMQFSQFNAKPI